MMKSGKTMVGNDCELGVEKMQSQIADFKRRICLWIGGAVCFSVLCMLGMIVYYELKLRDLTGSLYLIDEEAGRKLIHLLFQKGVHTEGLHAFAEGMVQQGYTANGNWYLFSKGDGMVISLFTTFVMMAILVSGIFLIRRIGRRDFFGEMKAVTEENQQLSKKMEELFVYTQKQTGKIYEFIENIAHQIKTPLTALTLSLDICTEHLQNVCKNGEVQRKSDLNELEQLQTLTDNAIFQAERIKAFIVRLMNISRLESGKVVMTQDEIHLNDFLYQAVALSNTGNCKITIQEVDESYWIDGDNDWLMDAFSNIISNACEHGTRVDIHVNIMPEKCLITVKDNGCGFQGKDYMKIFDRFESGSDKKSFHMGIGLNLSKLVIEAHHGNISAYNDEESGGAVFRIMLPQYHLKKGKVNKNRL